MLVSLSPNRGPPIKVKSVAISSTCPRLVNIVWIDKRYKLRRPISTNYLRPISVPEHCKKPEIELNDASLKVAG